MPQPRQGAAQAKITSHSDPSPRIRFSRFANSCTLSLMRWGMPVCVLGLLSPCSLAQQPFLHYGGAVNAASLTPAGLPGSGLPRGGIVTLYGRNLGPTSPVEASSLPLSEEFGGIRLELTAAGRSFSLLPIYVSPSQVNAIVPSGVPAGKASLRLRRGSLSSNPLPVRIESVNLGLFSVNFAGYGPGIVTNFVSENLQPVNSSLQPAAPGQRISLWATGLGPAPHPDNILPEAGNLPTQVEVFIGGEPAEILSSGRASTFPGLDLVSVRVPASAPLGCYVPVTARAAGSVSNTISIALAEPGTPCQDPHSPFSATLRNGGRTLRFFAERLSHLSDLFTRSPFEYLSDLATLQHSEHLPNPYAYQLPDSLPPPGTCTILTQQGLIGADLHPAFRNSGALLAAGLEATLRAAVTRTLEADPAIPAWQAFGDNLNPARPRLFRDGASTSLAGNGFSFQFQNASGFQWSTRATLSLVNRNRPLSVSWTGAAPGDLAVVAGGSSSTANDSSAFFLCVCDAARGAFTTPQYALSALPPQSAPFLFEEGALAVGLIKRSTAQSNPAEGYATALGIEALWSTRSVFFQ